MRSNYVLYGLIPATLQGRGVWIDEFSTMDGALDAVRSSKKRYPSYLVVEVVAKEPDAWRFVYHEVTREGSPIRTVTE